MNKINWNTNDVCEFYNNNNINYDSKINIYIIDNNLVSLTFKSIVK